MGFLQALQATLDEEYNLSVTENGAFGYRTTGSALSDLNFAVTSLRGEPISDIQRRFSKAYFEDRLLALKWMFFAGDVRGGLGERRLFRACLCYLADNHPDHARKLLPLVAEYTRWDNLFCLLDGALKDDVLQILSHQLAADLAAMQNGKKVSLLAKWLPSINATSKATRETAALLQRALGYTKSDYRKTLSALRRYSDVTEVKMSDGRWDAIRYESVPSRANLLYRNAFLRHDTDRRNAYLESLQTGKTSIHADVLFPHDIVSQYKTSQEYSCDLAPYDASLEALWKALPDYVDGDTSTLCVADGSASMLARIGCTRTTCLDVANALAIYFAERCAGDFRDKYVTFSQNPQLVDLSKGTCLRDKLEIALTHNEVANTNIEAVFRLILTIAIRGNMKQKDLPKNVLILSDMEFDHAIDKSVSCDHERLFTAIGKEYAQYGYRLPRLIFWNINSFTQTIPLRENPLGVALVSGFSPIIAKMVLSDELDPYKVLLETLNGERYAPIEKAFNG